MNMETKNQIFERYKGEYYKARADRKRSILTKILDTVCEAVRMNRKAAIRKFSNIQSKDPCSIESRGRKVYYTPDVIAALKDVWEAGNELCGELLFPMVREYVRILINDKMWENPDEATGKLFAMSRATMKAKVGDFLKARRKGRGFSLTSPSNLKHIIPIFTGPWKDELPGSGQIDTVAHCGSTLLGDFIYTLNLVDISTLWDIARAQWNKGQEATVASLEHIRNNLPFPLHGIHPDTGSEFINWLCKGYCDTNSINMTRSRPNHKNDNAYVEERNGHIVRKYVGYIRLDCKEAVPALNNLYAVLCPYLNHFIPSRKCINKVKIGSKYKKVYEKVPKTPYQRVLEHPKISEDVKNKLRKEHAILNPLIMKKEIDRLRSVLYDVQRKHGSQNSEKLEQKS
jgi:hypothetical protein